MILALLYRDFIATFTDKGRLFELVLYPLSFLVIWGLMFKSGIVAPELAAQLLVINLIWSTSSSLQGQTNGPIMYDLWSREFAELLKEGITMQLYIVARVLFGTAIGVTNLLVFLLASPLFFGVPASQLLPLVTTFPIYWCASIGLAYVVAALVIRLGRSYAFLAWTGLQFIVTLSSPYTPLESVPLWLRVPAYLSPYAHVFEHVRNGGMTWYMVGLLEGILLLVIGMVAYRRIFKEAKRVGRLVTA